MFRSVINKARETVWPFTSSHSARWPLVRHCALSQKTPSTCSLAAGSVRLSGISYFSYIFLPPQSTWRCLMCIRDVIAATNVWPSSLLGGASRRCHRQQCQQQRTNPPSVSMLAGVTHLLSSCHNENVAIIVWAGSVVPKLELHLTGRLIDAKKNKS